MVTPAILSPVRQHNRRRDRWRYGVKALAAITAAKTAPFRLVFSGGTALEIQIAPAIWPLRLSAVERHVISFIAEAFKRLPFPVFRLPR
ncbi:hypothetical protein SBA3_4490004 [Candidatus Sulfopaludibacter sp. SbA3]|nr:hypothetical protein SBA3_4490004 [Candidatus Sulfopaludibacter sp. SbA3]